ncbi:hypothetical protein BJ508DRAFT_328902 [Ascobolus immersus RN42]|uniref:Uncharacterized protein n=1 Tax=Ascobolus immersus RN42 TaxID=1160509 RepID=A0A3N4HYV4_ASCIM|nr:hypothetical protein BJ508DRAFT_328902 [Ascobolus immersus RN42]
MAPTDSSIKTSSDAWATLIANIATLLVLVGEKHVKEYFKTMSKPSHELLFAAGPIGLVTAVTTLVRLKGAPILKRLIGRTFETRGEIFKDVTGLSGTDVKFVLKNGALEQASEWDEKDVALFYWKGGMTGTVAEVKEHWKLAQKRLVQLRRSDVRSMDHRLLHSFMGGCIRMRGENALDIIMKNIKTRKERGFGDDLDFGTGDVDGAVYTSGCIADISLSLTANHCLDGKVTGLCRVLVSLFCLLGTAGLVIVNWFLQKDIENTTLIAVGAVISAACSFYTARIVKGMTTQQPYGLRAFNVCDSGFYSRDGENIQLLFTPTAVINSDYTFPWVSGKMQKDFDLVSHLVVLLVVIGYISLYLASWALGQPSGGFA